MPLLITRRGGLCHEGRSRAQHPRSARRRRHTGVYIGLPAAKLPHLPSLTPPLPPSPSSTFGASLQQPCSCRLISCFPPVLHHSLGAPVDTTDQSPRHVALYMPLPVVGVQCMHDPHFEELLQEYPLYEFLELLSVFKVGSRAADRTPNVPIPARPTSR